MITKDQVSEMISKHFGKVENKTDFLNELFENKRHEKGGNNVIFPATDYDVTTFLKIGDFEIDHIKTKSILSCQLEKESRVYLKNENGKAKYWFDCGNLYKSTSIRDFNEIVALEDLEFSVKQISKYFK